MASVEFWLVVATGIVVLVGYAVAASSWNTIPWGGFQTTYLKVFWGFSTLCVIASYSWFVIFVEFLDTHDTRPPLLLPVILFNVCASSWGFAYASCVSQQNTDFIANGAVIATAAASLFLMAITFAVDAPWHLKLVADVIAFHHVVVDFGTWFCKSKSALSWLSSASVISGASAASACSVLSLISFASVASTFSIFSIFSVNSIMSIGCVGKAFEVCY